jgi:hypothetical protein
MTVASHPGIDIRQDPQTETPQTAPLLGLAPRRQFTPPRRNSMQNHPGLVGMYGPPLGCKRKEKDAGSAQMYSAFYGVTLRTKMESARLWPH